MSGQTMELWRHKRQYRLRPNFQRNLVFGNLPPLTGIETLRVVYVRRWPRLTSDILLLPSESHQRSLALVDPFLLKVANLAVLGVS